ncbi:hypothetical protein BHM03_00015254 [Ensete ventricosum]|nr:hypothetical protein BHM03_00015254 [Ensete ventricosum]
MDADMDVGVRLRGCVLNPNPRLPTRIVVVLYRREANLDAPPPGAHPSPSPGYFIHVKNAWKGRNEGSPFIIYSTFPSAVVHSPWSYGVGAAVVLVVYRKSVWGWGTEGPFDSQNTSPTYLTTLGAFSLKVRT